MRPGTHLPKFNFKRGNYFKINNLVDLWWSHRGDPNYLILLSSILQRLRYALIVSEEI
jgi:hypothetical protein